MHLSRLFTGVLAWIGLGAALFAQNAQLRDGLFALANTSSGLVALDNEGALLRSINNGVDFTTTRGADDPRALYAVGASGSTVIAMGDAGYFVRSTDGGASYSTLAPAISGTFTGVIKSVAARDASNWVAAGVRNSAAVALVSVNGGASWNAAGSIDTASQLNGVVWTGSRWVAVGESALGNGVILTSTDGTSWTVLTTITFTPLYAVSSDGAGRVLIGGDAGTLLHATDGGATSSSFTSVDNGVVSEAIRSVAFLSGTNWVAGGDNAVIVTYNGTAPGVFSGPSSTVSAPVTALASTGDGTNYYYSEPAGETPEPHGPISLTATQSGGQIQLTLVGAESGYSYYLESSTTLSSWSVVDGSTQSYDGTNAPTWSYPLPAAGQRVFYRAANVTP